MKLSLVLFSLLVVVIIVYIIYGKANVPAPENPEQTGIFWIDDRDNDGISDKDDKCPFTPEEVVTDSDGCAIDSDRDGVPDYLDKCPETSILAIVDTDGCSLHADLKFFEYVVIRFKYLTRSTDIGTMINYCSYIYFATFFIGALLFLYFTFLFIRDFIRHKFKSKGILAFILMLWVFFTVILVLYYGYVLLAAGFEAYTDITILFMLLLTVIAIYIYGKLGIALRRLYLNNISRY